MKSFSKLVAGGLLLWASAAMAVSKVGGGTLSNEEVGFLFNIPHGYDRFSISSNQDVRMDGEPVFRAGVLEPRFIMTYLLANEAPHLATTDRKKFRDMFIAHYWLDQTKLGSCVEHWVKVNGNSVTRILSWGDGRGVILTTLLGNEADVRSAAFSLKLMPGAPCSWR